MFRCAIHLQVGLLILECEEHWCISTQSTHNFAPQIECPDPSPAMHSKSAPLPQRPHTCPANRSSADGSLDDAPLLRGVLSCTLRFRALPLGGAGGGGISSSREAGVLEPDGAEEAGGPVPLPEGPPDPERELDPLACLMCARVSLICAFTSPTTARFSALLTQYFIGSMPGNCLSISARSRRCLLGSKGSGHFDSRCRSGRRPFRS